MSETAIDYTTHILIGVKKSGEMTVLAQWPRVPRQADVDGKIQSAKEPYIKFVLCTPTSIMVPPGHRHSAGCGPSGERPGGLCILFVIIYQFLKNRFRIGSKPTHANLGCIVLRGWSPVLIRLYHVALAARSSIARSGAGRLE
jgi:hypothetical protein